MKIGDINPKDKKFWPSEPEPGFSPERNKAVIESTIKQYEAKRAEQMKTFRNGLAERVDALTSYLTSPKGAAVSKPLDRYFTRRELARLRGEEIVDEIRQRMRMVNPWLYRDANTGIVVDRRGVPVAQKGRAVNAKKAPQRAQ